MKKTVFIHISMPLSVPLVSVEMDEAFYLVSYSFLLEKIDIL
jgi:hypothetical protein